MLFYHFTARENLPAIQLEGLTKGEAPLSPTTWENAVNLTTDPNPVGHGLSKGEPISEAIIEAAIRQHGSAPLNTHWPDKTAVRIKVRIPSRDPLLKRWSSWSRKRADPSFLTSLHRAAGPGSKSKTWWLYFGTIPPSSFVNIDLLD